MDAYILRTQNEQNALELLDDGPTYSGCSSGM